LSVYDFIKKLTAGEIAGWAAALLILVFSLIQISPLKLNPWDHIFGWIGKRTNGATARRLETLEKQIRDMWINNHRQHILTFARECRASIEHSSDEWTNVLNVAEEYEKYVEKKPWDICLRHGTDCG
jgi:hypothetical protein